ncbi:MAG: hypothetical protein HQ481_15625 [Alphaproteobacteria bacterium]|nr:hypothetical protein [Alphaproteobacteria bacterium]
MLASALSGCGAGALLEGEEARRARVEAAVADALERERSWQSRFVERRTEALVARQQAASDETVVLQRRLAAIEHQIDSMIRARPRIMSALTDPEPAALPKQPPPPQISLTPAAPVVDAAEVEALRRDLDAMTGSVAQLLADRDHAAATLRARLERLELRTSTLSWPPREGVRAVHLASYRTHAAALAGWEILLARYRPLLITESPTFIEVETVAGRYVRLFVGVGLDKAALNRIIDSIRAGGDYGMILTLPGARAPSS